LTDCHYLKKVSVYIVVSIERTDIHIRVAVRAITSAFRGCSDR